MTDESKSSVRPCAWSRQRLSNSPLWRWQPNYFESRGIRAWSPGAVTYHVTSCPSTRWDRLLDDYRRRLPATTFLFPTAALRCIENLQKFSRGPELLLSGNKGHCRDEAQAKADVTFELGSLL
jgi:hypothetical protein